MLRFSSASVHGMFTRGLIHALESALQYALNAQEAQFLRLSADFSTLWFTIIQIQCSEGLIGADGLKVYVMISKVDFIKKKDSRVK